MSAREIGGSQTGKATLESTESRGGGRANCQVDNTN